jgi:hypothetical protein
VSFPTLEPKTGRTQLSIDLSLISILAGHVWRAVFFSLFGFDSVSSSFIDIRFIVLVFFITLLDAMVFVWLLVGALSACMVAV